jgi:hypothetical protein
VRIGDKNYMIQLPNDAVAVGYREVRPYHHAQVFTSETAGFTGTEEEFLLRGYAYAYRHGDRFTRSIVQDKRGD